jgi:hypothetical protein
MSGGSWDYLYRRVEDAADRLRCSNDPLRRALGAHLHDVAEALHAIEWVDSADYTPEQEIEPIRKVISPERETAIVLAAAQEMQAQLTELIGRLQEKTP